METNQPMKSMVISFVAILIAANIYARPPQSDNLNNKNECEVGVYYFPNYHLDKRNENYFGKGWSEWKLVKEARPKFMGHQQPKVPLWGYTDEADPKQMAQKIEAASAHGIDAFIFDWYYYDDGPFLQRGVEEGFMKAKNNDRLKFSLMWANHDYTDIFPHTSGIKRKMMYPGKISPQTWDKMTDYIIAKYFKHHSYWLIDGAPYFSIYDLGMFIKGFGTAEAAAKGLEDFRNKTKAAGFSDLHLNAVVKGVLPGKQGEDQAALIGKLAFNSCTSYVWYHHGGLTNFPATPYDSVKNTYFKYAEKAATQFGIPYYPNVSMGWDPSPRTSQNSEFTNSGYPHTPIIAGNTPEAFKTALIQAREFMDIHLKQNKILTVNAWNEWTEGSYLEPDTVHKMGYLNAVKEVFGNQNKSVPR
jgi:Glycosyltransferase WbsX